jgi:acetolactate synthase-1/2/3 large subunit
MKMFNKTKAVIHTDKNTSDAILDFLVSKGVNTVFLLTGGAIAFTVDAFSKRKDISYVCVQHEQAAAMMADAYARIKNNFAATMTTSGPGATNLITGIACSYFDSIGNIHITGQVNLSEQRGGMPDTMQSRQIGFQETDIVSIAKPITKKAVQLKSSDNILDVLDDLYKCSQSGRAGPVLLDLPMCMQRNIVKRKIYKDNKNEYAVKAKKKSIKKIFKIINKAQRPIIVAGGGIRYSNAVNEFNNLIKKLNIPVVTTWSGIDTIDHKSPLYYGHIGVYGSRAANFCVQNSDCIISLGSRLDTRITGGKPGTFGRDAKILMIDIDKGELKKRRGLKPHMEIQEDCKEFLNRCKNNISLFKKRDINDWLNYCNSVKIKYPTVSKDFSKDNKYVNPYLFSRELSNQLNSKDIIIPDDGGHLTWFMQSFELKIGQRVFSAFGNSPMGYSFPAAIGASIASRKKRVICIDGDGSFQINMQELQTVVNEKLPIKIFIYNNNGYGIIKQFQSLYLGGRYNASGKGVSIPNYKKIAKAYDIQYMSVSRNSSSNRIIKKALKSKSACIIEVFIHPEQKIVPKLAFGNPIEDLEPQLSREEFHNNMINKAIIPDSKLVEAN